jgi:hypothetical protein
VTAIPSAAVTETAAVASWPWLIDIDRYDRRAELTAAELSALQGLGLELLRGVDRDSAGWQSIQRLIVPLDDAQAALH